MPDPGRRVRTAGLRERAAVDRQLPGGAEDGIRAADSRRGGRHVRPRMATPVTILRRPVQPHQLCKPRSSSARRATRIDQPASSHGHRFDTSCSWAPAHTRSGATPTVVGRPVPARRLARCRQASDQVGQHHRTSRSPFAGARRTWRRTDTGRSYPTEQPLRNALRQAAFGEGRGGGNRDPPSRPSRSPTAAACGYSNEESGRCAAAPSRRCRVMFQVADMPRV